jgi:hypothetical protein
VRGLADAGGGGGRAGQRASGLAGGRAGRASGLAGGRAGRASGPAGDARYVVRRDSRDAGGASQRAKSYNEARPRALIPLWPA